MKIFDFLVKIAIFEAFLFRSIDSRHALLPETNARSRQDNKRGCVKLRIDHQTLRSILEY